MSVDILSSIQAQMQYDCCEDASKCWCRGSGWVVSDWDSLHKCPYHYEGQPNNEDPDWAWDLWQDNMHGNAQFMLIQEEWGEYEKTWENHVNRLGWLEEDLPF